MTLISKFHKKIKNHYNYFKSKKIYFNSQYDSKKITSIQLNKLKKILTIAVETVPYYQNLNLNINFDNFSLNELKKFPIINKKIIQRDMSKFISSKYKNKGLKSHTSGSSGKPFEFFVPIESDSLEDIFVHRAWSMSKNNEYKKNDPIIVLRTYSPKEGEPIYKVDLKKNYWYLSPFHINDENLNTYVNLIEKSKSKIIRGYPSSIYLFTLLLEKHNIKLPKIKTIITSSETLLPLYRTKIEKYWNLPVLDWYGQNERTVTIQQCWAGNYHTNDEYGILELNKQNHIIATSLNNYVMPFIRYDTEDIAIPLKRQIDKCPCGRELSIRLDGINGRCDDILTKSDGTKIPTINIYTLMHEFDKISQFKIVQEKDLSLFVYLVLLDNVNNAYLNKIKLGLIKRFGNLKIDFKLVNEIKRNTETGKVKIIESKVR